MHNNADIPYQLLGQSDQTSPLQGLSDSKNPDTAQAATTAYITTMYYSALSNLYLQSILPKDIADVDAQMPRVKVALERSFADFTQAAQWLAANNELINASSAKRYYDEVLNLDEGAIKNMATFYSSNHEQKDDTQSFQVNVSGALKFLHYYDPQHENEDTARAFQEFLISHYMTVATGGDDVIKELYRKFKEQNNIK